jgi:hypothetical protein
MDIIGMARRATLRLKDAPACGLRATCGAIVRH